MIHISLLLAIFLINIIFGLVIYAQNRQDPVSRDFLGLTLFIGLWALGSAANIFFKGTYLAHISEVSNSVFALFIAFFFFQFTLHFQYPSKLRHFDLRWLYLIVSLILAFFIYFTDYIYTNTTIENNISYTNFNPVGYLIWAAILSIPFIAGLLVLKNKLYLSDGVIRKRFSIFFTFIIFAIVGGMLVDVVLIFFNLYQFNNIGPFFSFFLIYPLARIAYFNKE